MKQTARAAIDGVPRLAGGLAAAAAVAIFVVAIRWGTDAAGGSDSYCYLSQARLIASGALHVDQPWVDSLLPPEMVRAAVPAGYTAARGPAGTIAPMCPAGLSIMMAAAFVAAGERGMLLLVPLLGAATVWMTYRLGRRLTTPAAAASASILVAASPIFLYQVVQPMSDVPAACFWMAALAIATGPATSWRAVLAGLAAGVALVIRPNLLLPAAVVGAWLMWNAGAETARVSRTAVSVRTAVWYVAGVLPAMVCIAVLQWAAYGSPLRSGYDELGSLFRVAHAWPNLQRYPTWLLESHTPAVALAAVAPFMQGEPPARRRRWLLAAFSIATFASYILYTPFDDWWYLRFLLPSIPCVIVLSAAVVADLVRYLPHIARAFIAVALTTGVTGWYVHVAQARSVFRLRASEARFIETGRYLARSTPPDAIAIAAFQSGSIRYYAGRRTIAWDGLDPRAFDGVIDRLRASGAPPVIVLERWEESRMRDGFGGTSSYGQLDWPPRAEIGRDVRIYDPADRARYWAGEFVPTERIWIDERR
jgi:hypothetical protein